MARTAPKPPDSPKPKRGKKGHNGAPPDTNEESFRLCLRASRDTRKTWQEKVEVARTEAGRYRSSRKILNKIGDTLGYQPKDIDWLMDALDREPDDIDAETARRTRLAKLAGLPLGTQLGLFDGGLTVATAVEDAVMVVESDFPSGGVQDLAYRAGYTACEGGFDRGDAPLDNSDAWLMGWDRCEAVRNAEIARREAERAPAAA